MESLVNYSSEEESEKYRARRRETKSPVNRQKSTRRNNVDSSAANSRDRKRDDAAKRSSSGRSNYHKEEDSRGPYKSATLFHSDRTRSDGRDEKARGMRHHDRHEAKEPKDYNSRDTRSARDSRDARNDRDARDSRTNDRDRHRDRDNRRKSPYNNRPSQYNNNGNRHYNNPKLSTSSSYQNERHSHGFRDQRSNRTRDERAITDRQRRRNSSRTPSPADYNHRKRLDGNDRPERHQSRHSRSRSRDRSKRSDKHDPMERARLSAIDIERKCRELNSANDEDFSPSNKVESIHALPLSEKAPKQPNVIAVASTTSTSLNQSSNSGGVVCTEPAVIQLPSYYNPSVINPNKYAEQVQKRKLLWGAKKVEDTSAKWGNAQFSQDSDGKVASKFMRLMGIKGAATAAPVVEAEKKESKGADVKSREVMFSNMEQQYEVARQVTHTMRGVGLGFSSQTRPF